MISPLPGVTMINIKVAIPLLMKPGIEDIPVPGSFVERTGEFHRAGLVVKLFGPCILIKTFNPWGGLSDRTADSFEETRFNIGQIVQDLTVGPFLLLIDSLNIPLFYIK